MLCRTTTALVVSLTAAAALTFVAASRAQEAKGAAPVAAAAAAAKAPHLLVGTWRLVSAKYGGQAADLSGGVTMVKHVTGSQFMWAMYDKDGKVARAAGGAYKIDGDKYAETPEYGISADFDEIKGKTHTFTWKVDGNKWYHNGALAGGLTIEEVWERVEPGK